MVLFSFSEMIAGENSNLCLEGCRLPATDSYLSLQNINSYRLEGADMVFKENNIPWNKGKHDCISEEGKNRIRVAVSLAQTGRKRSEETRKKMSIAFRGRKISEEGKRNMRIGQKGKKQPPRTQEYKDRVSRQHKGKIISPETRQKASNYMKGRFVEDKNPNWKGGKKIWVAKLNAKRRAKGFVLLTDKNPYNEPIEYHHIHPDLPYVVPCPKRIHQAFDGQNHFQNVNAILGIMGVDCIGII